MVLTRVNDSLSSSESSSCDSEGSDLEEVDDSDFENEDEDAYKIDQKNLYIECKVFKHDEIIITIDIDLNRYPELRDDLLNIFSVKVSLLDLARKLENDLIMFEIAPDRYQLAFKDESKLPQNDNENDDL